ncbi:MAG: 4-hydroxybenzoyl-CoA reductase subunit beta [Gammaproteobacteria bacterium]|nr:FAD binding domain-containing protein [Gammaproteobacteria bacterium]NND37212.1 4-hydroxybenzoyl-CoA reductase subunit beta [Gammaproteobacteria bacterium]
MLLPAHDFLKPPTLDETLAALKAANGEVKLIGGGTDVVFNMRGRLFRPDILLSVKDLPELQIVEELPDGSLRIGSGSRLTDLEVHPSLQRVPCLVAAVRAVASRHVRNMATLGGNLCLDTRCWYVNQSADWRAAKGPCMKTGRDYCHAIRSSTVCVALNASDIAPALISLDAIAELASADGTRDIALADFYTDNGVTHTVRRPDEILVAVRVPPADGAMVYLKETARKGNDFSYGTIAARLKADGDVRIVIGALTTRPAVLQEPARIIRELGLDDESIDAAVDATRTELGALTNLYTPAAYKSTLARGLVRRALTRLRKATA